MPIDWGKIAVAKLLFDKYNKTQSQNKRSVSTPGREMRVCHACGVHVPYKEAKNTGSNWLLIDTIKYFCPECKESKDRGHLGCFGIVAIYSFIFAGIYEIRDYLSEWVYDLLIFVVVGIPCLAYCRWLVGCGGGEYRIGRN